MGRSPHSHKLAGSWPGVASALASAALFGASTPLAKVLLDRVDPWMLAGLLYLGAGLGLLVLRFLRLLSSSRWTAESPVRGFQWFWLGGAILSGGVIGPVLLMIGLKATAASSASLLLNLEAIFSVLLAWFVFREGFSRRIALGMTSIVAGAVLLSWPATLTLEELLGPLAIVGACLAWALDNNLTQKVSLSDPLQIVMLKGLTGGSVNIGLAFLQGAVWPGLIIAAAAGIVGLFGYGISLVFFVLALRQIGTARTMAYYSVAPFVGAAIAIVGLNEPLSGQFVVAGLLMTLGVWLHLTERHVHEHAHQRVIHSHRHVHDVHHRHEHGQGEPEGQPHAHVHVHAPSRHRHPHYPDAHHRHKH